MDQWLLEAGDMVRVRRGVIKQSTKTFQGGENTPYDIIMMDTPLYTCPKP